MVPACAKFGHFDLWKEIALQSLLMDVDIRFVDILRFVDTFSESENATNEKTQEIQVFFCGKNTKNFACLVYFS